MWENEGQGQVHAFIRAAYSLLRGVLINLDWIMSLGSVPFQYCLAEYVPVKYQLSAEFWKKRSSRIKRTCFHAPLLLFVCVSICVCSRWLALSVHQPQVCFVPVQRPVPPRAKPPCDLRPRGATGRSSPYFRTCDRRCGWPAPGGWLKGGEQWPWGGGKGQIDFNRLFWLLLDRKHLLLKRQLFQIKQA